MADQRDRPPVEPTEAGHDGGVVHAPAIAVQLEPVVEDPGDVVERVRAILMARELDAMPDLLVAGVRSEPLELALQALRLGARASCRGAASPRRASPGGRGARARPPCSRRATEQPQQPSHRRPQLASRHDRVDVAEPVVGLRQPEVVRELLARRLRNHPRPRERHQGARLGEQARRRGSRSSPAARPSWDARARKAARRPRRAGPRPRTRSSAAASATGCPPASGHHPKPTRTPARRAPRPPPRMRARTSRRRRSPSNRP